ncbi:MAG: 4-hydroxy-tetrahydrodipicolinate reductase [Thermodesulfobacteriota bacterium]
MIKVAISGIAGRMGRSVLSVLNGDKDIVIVGGSERDGHETIGVNIGSLIGVDSLNIPVTTDFEEASRDADVLVDFTNPDVAVSRVEFASNTGKAMVIGTTGFSADQVNTIRELTNNFACVLSPNMSIGVNVFLEVATKLASYLGDDYDVEIIEAHHSLKQDSPSGTALKLGRDIARALDRDFEKIARYERHGRIGERPKKEIGMNTIRGGDIIGEHTAMFCGIGERIELTHRATDRSNFSKGALRSVKWVFGKQPGLYSMKDVLNL